MPKTLLKQFNKSCVKTSKPPFSSSSSSSSSFTLTLYFWAFLYPLFYSSSFFSYFSSWFFPFSCSFSFTFVLLDPLVLLQPLFFSYFFLLQLLVFPSYLFSPFSCYSLPSSSSPPCLPAPYSFSPCSHPPPPPPLCSPPCSSVLVLLLLLILILHFLHLFHDLVILLAPLIVLVLLLLIFSCHHLLFLSTPPRCFLSPCCYSCPYFSLTSLLLFLFSSCSLFLSSTFFTYFFITLISCCSPSPASHYA